jgi:hypothetical protein
MKSFLILLAPLTLAASILHPGSQASAQTHTHPDVTATAHSSSVIPDLPYIPEPKGLQPSTEPVVANSVLPNLPYIPEPKVLQPSTEPVVANSVLPNLPYIPEPRVQMPA